jgi:hypothetical protein
VLVNPYHQRMTTFDGTRLLLETLGIVGLGVRDVTDSQRFWTVQSLYAPISQRTLGGIRAKLSDRNDFVTFVNQRDLEVLLGIGKPGEPCLWTGRRYVGPEDDEWVGFCADEEDLLDDLQEREMLLRSKYPGVLPYGLELVRRVHREKGNDIEELWTSLWDADPETGMGPDVRLSTLRHRWVRIEQRRLT